ncbi:MAG: ABC transporter permease [Gemmatimonadaceae bacterium]
MRTLRFLLRKEFLQIFRDRLMVLQMIIMPLFQLLLLASAATFEVKSAKMYVVDRDHSSASRGLISRLQAGGRFVLAGASSSMSVADEEMLGRRAAVIVSIPADFERDLVRTHMAQVQLVMNAEDGATAGVTQSYAAQIIASYAREIGVSIAPAVREGPSIEVRSRGLYNAELNYRDYMVPGILVQLVTVVGTLLTAMNIVREKELGTLDQLSVTPLGTGVFIAAKLIPLWLIALLELSLGLLVARFVFHIPMRGNLLIVFGAAGLYLIAALGIGLFVSTLASTQQQAMFVTFFIVMIYLLMSGMFTPVRSMPVWAQWMAQLNPLKHFIEIMRAVLLKGAGVTDVLRPLAAISAFGAVVLTLAVRQYGRRIA